MTHLMYFFNDPLCSYELVWIWSLKDPIKDVRTIILNALWSGHINLRNYLEICLGKLIFTIFVSLVLSYFMLFLGPQKLEQFFKKILRVRLKFLGNYRKCIFSHITLSYILSKEEFKIWDDRFIKFFNINLAFNLICYIWTFKRDCIIENIVNQGIWLSLMIFLTKISLYRNK